MGKHTDISWTHHTFNPVWGCARVSAECTHCLSPSTRVLMADGSWRPIGYLAVGDKVYGFSDNEGTGRNRLSSSAEVLALWRTIKPAIRVTTASGRSVVASLDHRWLVKSARPHWKTTSQLSVGAPLSMFGDPATSADRWDMDYQAGYIAGATAGDGTMRFDPLWRSDKKGYPQMYWRVAVLAEDRPILDRLMEYLDGVGVVTTVKPFSTGNVPTRKTMLRVECRSKTDLTVIASLLVERSSAQWKAGWLAGFMDTDGSCSRGTSKSSVVHRWSQVYARNDHLDRTVGFLADLGFRSKLEVHTTHASCVRLDVSNFEERMRFVGSIQPALRRKGIERAYGMRHVLIADPVVSLELVGERPLVDITTTTGTFVAEGLSTHNCYAEAFAKRTGNDVWGKNASRRTFGEKHWAEPLAWNREAMAALQSRRVFCASMADVFEDHPTWDVERPKLWDLIDRTNWLHWLLLTKRPENIYAMVPWEDREWPHNVWVGTTVGVQASMGRVALLNNVVPARFRFLSVEPLLERVDLGLAGSRIDWVIVGGESGPKRREMDPAWLVDVVAQAKAAGIPVWVKQDSGLRPGQQGRIPDDVWALKEVPL